MLRAFIPLKKKPVPGERNPSIVVLDLDPYLNFDAIEALLPGGSEEAIALVDLLTSRRLLRRGLILDCAECGRPSFIHADKVSQQYECPQCAGLNDLVSKRWKSKTTEPVWFYGLYTAFSELLAANGDVVLLAARSLRSNSRSYMDAPELEFFDAETGEPVAEVDVIASADRELILVEAKSNGTFSSKRGPQSKKLLQIARVLRATKIVLATTKDHWNETDVSHLSSEGEKMTPFQVSVETSTLLAQGGSILPKADPSSTTG